MIEKDPGDTVAKRIRTRAAARELRRRTTPTEDRLWTVVRRRQIGGLLFRRQDPIGPYIVDMVCHSARLVVEVDGEIHEQQQEYDAERDDYLRHMGFTVMRVTTERVLCDLNGVICEIRTACAAPPLPRTGEGVEGGGSPTDRGR